MKKTDFAIVGGGIIGIAHAVAALEKGYSVRLFEKEQKAVGASVRNFGLVWPIGQPAGNLYDRAIRSRDKWIEMAEKAGFWAFQNGSLHIAYAEDELAILEEYHQKFGNETELFSPEKIRELSPSVRKENLRGGLYSKTEVNVNPKKAIYALTEWLENQPECEIRQGEKVLHTEPGKIKTTQGSHEAEQILVCSGSDFQSLYPEVFQESPLVKCKLQMIRTEPQANDFKLGPTLCGGLTLRHYASFAQCKTLDVYRNRISSEHPEFDKWGIHVMVSQNEFNELIIGDSHEYGLTFDPFDKDEINQIILEYMRGFLSVDELSLKESWHGVYAKHPELTEFVLSPESGVTVITGFGGAGMTFSFGYAIEHLEGY